MFPPTARVVIVDRHPRQPRHFLNTDVITALVRKYGLEPEWVIVSNNNTFREQVCAHTH